MAYHVRFYSKCWKLSTFWNCSWDPAYVNWIIPYQTSNDNQGVFCRWCDAHIGRNGEWKVRPVHFLSSSPLTIAVWYWAYISLHNHWRHPLPPLALNNNSSGMLNIWAWSSSSYRGKSWLAPCTKSSVRINYSEWKAVVRACSHHNGFHSLNSLFYYTIPTYY